MGSACRGLKDTGFKGQFRFLKTPAPWLILGATALGNGGVFCWYSYINPMLTNVSGFSAESITPLMILAGFGMVMGNLISGRLSDRYTPGKVGTAAQALICIMLLLIFFLSPYKWAAALLRVDALYFLLSYNLYFIFILLTISVLSIVYVDYFPYLYKIL